MSVKDKMVSWFLRSVIKPRNEEMDIPGFIYTKVGGSGGIKLREIFLPEMFYVDLEDTVIDELEDGKRWLYRAGKKFGRRYAECGSFPNLSDNSNDEIESFFDFFVKYIEIIYATDIEYDLDLVEKNFDLIAKDYVICRENGKGYIFTTGAVAGVVSYTFDQKNIDAIQPKCQGRGAECCKVICGEKDEIDRVNFYDDQIDYKSMSNDYHNANAERKIKNSNASIKKLIDKNFFKYERGFLSFRGERYVPSEISLFYILESELIDSDIDEDKLFNVAYNVGKKITKRENDISFIPDYMSSLGWGDLFIKSKDYSVHINHLPWTNYTEETDLILLRGFISGLVSGILDDDMMYNNYSAKLMSNGYNISLKQR